MRKFLFLTANWGLALALFTEAFPCEYTSDMPPRVYPLRDVMLSKERYNELALSWERYRETHPEAALATVNWLRARRYSRDTQNLDPLALLHDAIELEPDCAEVLVELGFEEFGRSLQNGEPPMPEVQARFQRAATLAPDWPMPHFYLFNIALLFEDAKAMQSELDILVHKHAFPAPLLDFGYNLLVSADSQGIVLTNGDNDTYPALAVQRIFGVRPDVRIVNLSLLNLARYAKPALCGQGPDSGPFTEKEVLSRKKEGQSEFVDGRALVKELMEKVARGECKQPVYFAVTVPSSYLEQVVQQELLMEGLLLHVQSHVAPKPSEETAIALEKTDSLLTRTYRLESATDFNYAWTPESAVAKLMWNYFSLWYRAATVHAERGDLDGVRRMLQPAVTWLEFHRELRRARDEDPLPHVLAYWEKLDPQNPEIRRRMNRGKN